MNQKVVLRLAAIISGISGLVILFGVFYPILSYNTSYARNYSQLISPLANDEKMIKGIDTSTDPDYTQASSWFVGGATHDDFGISKVEYYNLSIPKLKIDGAPVVIGGEDLSEGVIHYPGTALPGKRGNSVLFGHSILPIFYNPKNVLSIFSLLPTLKIGDEILVDYDGVSYKFEVETMFEVMPTDLQVLDQDTTDSFLTLVTCVPPGDPRNPKRLIVRARVIPPT